jgi:hypothetical protein
VLYRAIGTVLTTADQWTSNMWAPFDFPIIALVREVELDVETDSAATLGVYSGLPGAALALQHSGAVDSSATGRRPVNVRVPSTTLGHHFELRLWGAETRLFGGRMYCRPLGMAADWRWVAIPNIIPTAEEWSDFRLPIRGGALPAGGGDDWRWVDLATDDIA